MPDMLYEITDAGKAALRAAGAPRIEITTTPVWSVPIRFAHGPRPDGGRRSEGDRFALLGQSAIGAPRPAAALSRRARTCHDAGRKGRHDQSDFTKNAAACLRFGFRHWNSVTRPAACSAVA